MSDVGVPDVELNASIVDADFDNKETTFTVVECPEDEPPLLTVTRTVEPPANKRMRLDENALAGASDSVSIKQILFNINQAICLRLDAIESKLESVSNTTKMLEDKIENLCTTQSKSGDESPDTSINTSAVPNTPTKDNSTSGSATPGTGKKPPGGGAVVIGMPQAARANSSGNLSGSDDENPQEKYVVNLAGNNNLNNVDQSVQNLGPNVTLITLNSEEDFPNGTWLGDETNPEMRVRVPISPSDLLHVHSNCRTAEKMALTLLDYLFDRETQAYSNLSGMGKHGKKQLDPLMIYGLRCHLIHHFNVTEHDWHRIKQNINSKCRTAFRRKVRGLPLTVKAFRGKAPPTYIHIPSGRRMRMSDIGDASDDDLQHDDTELQIHTEVDVSQAGLLGGTPGTTELIQSAGGQIQVLHATPEQVAQLQQTHQIQILQGDQLMHFQDNQESVHVAVPMPSGDVENIQVINTDNGESIRLPDGAIAHEIVGNHIPKVESDCDTEPA